MSQIVLSDIDVRGLSAGAIELMKTAVRYAFANKNFVQHNMPFQEFYRLAGQLPSTTEQFPILVEEAQKAIAFIEVIDTAFPDRDDLPYSSWQVFKHIRAEGLHIVFEVDQQTYHHLLRENFSKNKICLEPDFVAISYD